ncbi:MAG: hypothetical protein R3C45_13320 [Phycisphaerales bacterium]
MMHKVSKFLTGASVVAALTAAGTAQAGHFATITIDDDYSDWAGVPVVDTDPADNLGGVDFFEVQIANDDDYLYIRNTYHTAKALSTFLAIDIDENVATGYDIRGRPDRLKPAGRTTSRSAKTRPYSTPARWSATSSAAATPCSPPSPMWSPASWLSS